MKQKFKIKDYTEYCLYWDNDNKCMFKFMGLTEHFEPLGIVSNCDIEAFEAFLTHNPKAKNLTLESAKELLKTFLDNQK